MSQNNIAALAALTTLAIRVDLQGTTIPNSQGQHFPLASSGVVIGKSYAAELAKQGVTLDDHARLAIVAALFSEFDLSQIDLSNDILTVKAGKQAIAVDMSAYIGRVRAALRESKLASIRERVSCDILDLVEQDDHVVIIGYSKVAL